MVIFAMSFEPPRRGFDGLITKILATPAVGIITVLIMTIIYFFSLRKHVTVDQLLNGGRTFYCHSVVELDDLEQELKDLARRFHLTLEKAKNWGGREMNPIPEGEILYLSDAEYRERRVVIEDMLFKAGKKVKEMLQPIGAPPPPRPGPGPAGGVPRNDPPITPSGGAPSTAPIQPVAPTQAASATPSAQEFQPPPPPSPSVPPQPPVSVVPAPPSSAPSAPPPVPPAPPVRQPSPPEPDQTFGAHPLAPRPPSDREGG